MVSTSIVQRKRNCGIVLSWILGVVVVCNLLFSSPPSWQPEHQDRRGSAEPRNHNAAAVGGFVAKTTGSKSSTIIQDDDLKRMRIELLEKETIAPSINLSATAVGESNQEANRESKQSSSSPSSSFGTAALEHVMARRQAYADAGDLERWKFRGLGYLYTHHGMVLQASLGGGGDGDSGGSNSNGSPHLVKPGRNVVEIHDVNQKLSRDECKLLVMWVRVNGPEIFAGAAQAIIPERGEHGDDNAATAAAEPPCHWEFPFLLRESGIYHIDVKLLLWNPHTAVEGYYGKTRIDKGVSGIQCPFQEGGPDSVYSSLQNTSNHNNNDNHDYPLHQGIHGFKFYGPVKSCCEICSRLRPHCKHWATPPDYFNASDVRNGCELYYKDPTNMIPPSKLLPNRTGTTTTSVATLSMTGSRPEKHVSHRRRLASGVPQFHGDPHSNPTTYFLGCGWSFAYTLDYPCLSGALDDRVYVAHPNFTFTAASPLTAATTSSASAAAAALQADSTELPLCTLDQEALDSHAGRWVRAPFPNRTVCPNDMEVDMDFKAKFDIMQFDATHPHCWHRDDFHNVGHRCMESNCQLITKESKWISRVHEETKFYGIWKPYGCHYVEFTNEQLQTCITNKKIARIEIKGDSIADFLREYLRLRLKHITMYNSSQSVENDGRSVILSTLKLLHKMNVPDVDMVQEIVKETTPASKLQDLYWVSGFFLSSERCDHCHMSRMNMMNHQTNKTLEKYGSSYKMINAFDMSAAFTYDTATQFDGMHIIGPTMKMIITKLFHYMCKDEVPDGSRLGSMV